MDEFAAPTAIASNQSPPKWMTAYGWLLIASYVLLQPYGHAFELPIILMAGLGLWLLLSQPRTILAFPSLKPMLLLFACIWLPMLFSLTDAIYLPRAVHTTLAFLRFPLAGLFILFALQQQGPRKRLLLTTAIVLSFDCVWIIVLAISGHFQHGRITNVPFPIGQFIGVMSPILFFWVMVMGQKKIWAWLLLPISTAAVLFTGSRASWIMFGVAFLLFFLQHFFKKGVRANRKTGVAIILLLIMGVTSVFLMPAMKHRIIETAGLFSGDYKKANLATSLRLSIWSVAVRVAEDHWINGVGPRSFRYIYSKYVPNDDQWLNLNQDMSTYLRFNKLGPNHPHQFFLEVAAETGGIGLAGYLFAFFYWVRLSVKATREKMNTALPWMVAVLVAIMPINAHMAFYASFWSCITWWLIAVSLAYWQADRVKEKID